MAVGEAAWRVLLREGPRGLSVRSVAAESGLATGSMRRSFPTQASLVAFCLDLVRRRVTGRIQALPTEGEPADIALRMLSELLPLDADRRMEMEVFLALGSLDPGDRELEAALTTAHADLADLCRRLVDALAPDAAERDGRTLHALLDGLALHLVRQPADASGEWAVDVLHGHLDSLG
ncbi:TetR/AcrR family transcriptional regulator [Nakamurella flavida]